MKLRIALISIAMAAATALSGCASAGMPGIGTQIALNADAKLTPRDRQMLALAPAEEWQIPIVRRRVPDPTGEPPGTIVIDTTVKNLYFVLPGRQAIQYKVATGAESYGWTGRATVGQMQEWPRWMPTASLMTRLETTARTWSPHRERYSSRATIPVMTSVTPITNRPLIWT